MLDISNETLKSTTLPTCSKGLEQASQPTYTAWQSADTCTHHSIVLPMEFHGSKLWPQLTKSSAEDSKSVDRDNLKPSGKRKLWE